MQLSNQTTILLVFKFAVAYHHFSVQDAEGSWKGDEYFVQ